jgi:hypothetical protein
MTRGGVSGQAVLPCRRRQHPHLQRRIARHKVYGHRTEVAMRALVMLLAALPVTAEAQGYSTIPQPVIPQTVVPGATAPAAPYGYGGPTVVAPVQGGGGVILTPGYPPGYVAPIGPGGTGAIIAPGYSPTYIVPSQGGGTAVITPGQGTTVIRRNPMGGTTIVGPDQPTTIINPIPGGRGGATIIGPTGAPGYVVPTPQGTYVQPSGEIPPTYIYRP